MLIRVFHAKHVLTFFLMLSYCKPKYHGHHVSLCCADVQVIHIQWSLAAKSAHASIPLSYAVLCKITGFHYVTMIQSYRLVKGKILQNKENYKHFICRILNVIQGVPTGHARKITLLFVKM